MCSKTSKQAIISNDESILSKQKELDNHSLRRFAKIIVEYLKANKKYNKIISIAVLHHLQTLEEQIAAIKNLCDCLDNNGKLLVSFWSKEKTFDDIKEHEGCIITGESIGVTVNNIKSKSDCRDFVSGPNYVSWKLDRENIIQRFYYIHDYKSIQELAKNINVKYTISWEQQNWFILFTKD